MTIEVGVNLLWLVPGEVGGSEQSTLATLRALDDLGSPHLRLRLLALAPLLDAHPDLADRFAVDVLARSGRSRPARVVAEATWLASRTRALDLVHHAGGTAPPRRRGVPYVLTLHDLQPLERRATHGSLKRAYLAAAIPPSVRRAEAVAVPSEFVRRSVIERFDADPDRVVTIPHGVDLAAAAGTDAGELRRRYDLPAAVVLYPAITYPHKNHRVLVQAFAAVAAAHLESVLVLPGGIGSDEDELQREIERQGLSRRVRRLGRISDADVVGLLQLATVVAVPSRYEGFGLPAVEAMAAGTALVAADATALPEVVGDGGLLVDPDDVGAWSDAITGLLDDPGARRRLVERGRARAARFSWSANAAGFAALYQQAAGSS